MQQRRTRLPELPEFGQGDMLFTLKDITYTPSMPRKNVPFTVTGKIELFGIPYMLPIWVVAKVTYPEEWWEEIIPIWGSPTVGEGQTALGGDFEIKFPRGFDREGEFALDVEAHLGPTFTVDKMTIPPFPPMASQAMTFIVAGEVPPEEVGFRNFRILSYSKNGGPPVTPPGVLELDIGDRCRVNVGFDHMNGEVTGKFHAAIWQWRPWDPHDEILNAEKTFTVPSSPDWVPVEDSIDIIITSAISPGSEYGLYVKIMGITGGDIFTEYMENVITIVGVPPEEADIKNFDFKLTKGTYDIGANVPFTAPYDYKGIEQEGQLVIEIGTGVYPTFNSVYTYAPIPVHFDVAAEWERRGLSGDITLPDTLITGQTYSVRAKLETLEIRTQEIDTDWSAFDIAGLELELLEIKIDPVGAGHVTTDVTPESGTQHNWYFPHGTIVNVTAHPNPGYVFESWSGEMTDTTDITAPVYAMTEKRTITAHFKPEEVPPPTTDIRNFDFKAQKGTYDIGDRVSFTAPYEYKGKAQSGYLTISLGTGTAPSFFTKHTFARVKISLDEAMDWEPRQLQGSFELPDTLVAGQTYNVRAKLETADGKQETDTDWGVFTITALPPEEQFTLELASEPFVGGTIKDEPDKPYYSYGEVVKLTANPSTWLGYRFSHWTFDGEYMGTQNPINLMMTRSGRVTAYFIT